MGRESQPNKFERFKRPITRTESTGDMFDVMEERDADGNRLNAAAYCENPVSEPEQEDVKVLAASKKARKKMLWYKSDKGDYPPSVVDMFRNVADQIRTEFGSSPEAARALTALEKIATETLEMCERMQGYELMKFDVRYDAPRWFNFRNQLQHFHADIRTDPETSLPDEPATESGLRVVRTYTGNSTEYLAGTDENKDEIIKPAPGSTVIHASPSLTLHRQPQTPVGEVRFAVVLDFQPIKQA